MTPAPPDSDFAVDAELPLVLLSALRLEAALPATWPAEAVLGDWFAEDGIFWPAPSWLAQALSKETRRQVIGAIALELDSLNIA